MKQRLSKRYCAKVSDIKMKPMHGTDVPLVEPRNRKERRLAAKWARRSRK